MKIIVLTGGTNEDKTIIIDMVFVALHIKGGKRNTFTFVQSPLGMDFEADLDYSTGGMTQHIAMYSKGNNIDHCNAAIEKYSQLNVGVLIIACSKNPTSLITQQNDTLVVVKKTPASLLLSQVKANTKDCHKIISLI
jgi:predicted SpoU family rRNA methylase